MSNSFHCVYDPFFWKSHKHDWSSFGFHQFVLSVTLILRPVSPVALVSAINDHIRFLRKIGLIAFVLCQLVKTQSSTY